MEPEAPRSANAAPNTQQLQLSSSFVADDEAEHLLPLAVSPHPFGTDAAAASDAAGSAAAAPAATVPCIPTKAVLCLCGAHTLARWGWRTWEFAVALILIKLFPSSLLLVSVYGLLDNVVRVLCGSVIGQFVDRTERLRGAVVCYGIQNMCIAVSAAAAAALVLLDASANGQLLTTRPVLYWCLISLTLLAGASSSVGSLGAAVAVEREYAKTLCGNDSTALRKLNSGMRAIDLLSQMLGPVVSGLIMSYGSMLSAILVLSCYCLLAWAPESLCLQAAHRYAPQLREPKRPPSASHPNNSKHAKPNAFQILLGTAGWVTYFHQGPSLLPGLALALLYLTVLSLGFLMTSFLAWQGMSEGVGPTVISLFRSVGALSGLLATFVFHPLQHCGVSLVGTGTLGISWQLAFLLAGVVPVVLARLLVTTTSLDHQAAIPNNMPGAIGSDQLLNSTAALHSLLNASQAAFQPLPAPTPVIPPNSNSTYSSLGAANITSNSNSPPIGGLPYSHFPVLYVLLSGLVASRFGLWLFDLAVSQLQQELVPDNELGTVSGVQASLQSAFEILSFVAGAVMHRPEHFHVLMAGSVVVVATAAGLYYVFACRVGASLHASRSGAQDAGCSRQLVASLVSCVQRVCCFRRNRRQLMYRHESDLPMQEL